MTEQLTKNEGKENIQPSYRFIICRPGGNDTALVFANIEDLDQRKRINDIILGTYPTVEQVGFINPDSKDPSLTMAGGEFCGNATRSTAWQYLDGQPGQMKLKVSGVKNKLRAGVTPTMDAYAQMPIYQSTKYIQEDPKIPGNYTVIMEGITHYVDTNTFIEGLTTDEIKTLGMKILQEKKFDQLYPASGVMFAKRVGTEIQINPVVYVRDVGTLYYESACGSGTTAVGLVQALRTNKSINDLPIIQPSGLPIKVFVEFDGKRFDSAYITGPIKKLAEGELNVLTGKVQEEMIYE